VFLGTHPLRLDEKGRLFLPAKWRPDLAGGLVITKGQEHCLYVFARQEFTRVSDLLATSPVTPKRLREYSRVLFTSASDETPDRQGRLTVPPPLRTYAGLERECVAAGVNSRVEIWAAPAWETYLRETEGSFAEMSEEVLPGVL
jgi:MraZ protein